MNGNWNIGGSGDFDRSPYAHGSGAQTPDRRDGEAASSRSPAGSPAARAPFGPLAPYGRQPAPDQRERPRRSGALAHDPTGFSPESPKLAYPPLRLDGLEHLWDLPGPRPRAVYRDADDVRWTLTQLPPAICDEWVIASLIYRFVGAPAAECRHVWRYDGKSTVALRQIAGDLDHSMERLTQHELSKRNGVYEWHPIDKLLGNDAVGATLGIHRESGIAVRASFEGVLLHDFDGNPKPEFGTGIWGFGLDSAPMVDVKTAEIFRRVPEEFIARGADLLARLDDRVLQIVVDSNMHHSIGKRDPLITTLIERRNTMTSDIRRSGRVRPPIGPMKSSVAQDDPAIEYLRHATWPPRAALEFIAAQFPEAVFYVDTDGTRQIISSASQRDQAQAYNTFGFEVEDDPRFIRVYTDIDAVATMLLRFHGTAGWATDNAKPGSTPVHCASEPTLIAAGEPRARPAYVYAFVPDKERTSFQADPYLRRALRTDRPFVPLICIQATAKELMPDLYLLPEFIDGSHPHYWQRRLAGTTPKHALMVSPSSPIPAELYGVPFTPVEEEALRALRLPHAAIHASIDARHPYPHVPAALHEAGAVMIEPNGMVWLVQQPGGNGWALPKRRVASGALRPDAALDAVNGQLGLHGPLLGYVDDFDDPHSSCRTRYFVGRRHAGSPLGKSAALVSIDDALKLVRDNTDVQALSRIRAALHPASWRDQATNDELALRRDPQALSALPTKDVTHPFVQLRMGVSRVHETNRIARPPKIWRAETVLDGKETPYTARRSELYVSLPGKPAIKMTSLEFERAGAPPDEPTVVIQGGGPGASPAWYLGGGLGPIIVNERNEVVPNPESLLSCARLLFLDAPGTGDSYMSDRSHEKYFNLEDDANVHAEYLMQYRGREPERLGASPIFAMGTSYGVHRWTRAMDRLSDHRVPLGGLFLVSGHLSAALTDFAPESITSYAGAIVPFAATARQHFPEMQRRYPDETEFLREVDRFASYEYMLAIARGNALLREDPERFDRVARKLAEFIHLDVDYVKEKRLQISPLEFCSSLLPGQTIAALDARMKTTAVPTEPGADPFAYVLKDMASNFQTALTAFMRRDLDYWPTDDLARPYVVLDVSYDRWGWGPYQNSPTRSQNHLMDMLRKNPKVNVFAAAGRYDVRSPFTQHTYAFNHLPREVAARISFRTYAGGHMFYMTDSDSREQFIGDMREFIAQQKAAVVRNA
ncbi:hypothetical protein GWC77_10345 [Paraburkholderia sp. NMBU_R16]|uniref:S10 family serine carboxypeptidase-like protein n=1 Tax=Paraburkholderia sp. NMBU_R16 TaxID=2698676 RepID=UPI001563DD4B|nr:hypothetical protein [Paraburkholderia sp. NMBU_R16]NRO96330.1 hypothetical protein [Paraburkholderia sp. NMBU_R16]